MNQPFDAYRESYAEVVEQSVAFSGLRHDFFMAAKADVLARAIADRLPAGADTMLDVGCGVGSAHRWIAPLSRTLAGTDPSAESIARARIENPNVAYALGDGRALPYAAGSFDVVTAICVIHHVPPQDWPAFVAEMRRVARPGGLIAIVEHNPLNPGTRLAVARCPFDADATLLGARTARALLTDAGCRDVASRHFLLLPTAAAAARGIERALARLPLGAQYAAFATA